MNITWDTESDTEYCAKCGKHMEHFDDEYEIFLDTIERMVNEYHEGEELDDGNQGSLRRSMMSPTDYEYYNLCGECAGEAWFEGHYLSEYLNL